MPDVQKSTSSSFIVLLFSLMGIAAVVLSLRNTFSKQLPADTRSTLCIEKKIPLVQVNVDTIVQRLSELISVPSGVPIVAVIEDLEKLKKENLEFYQEAQQGDYVISWPTKVVLYSTSKNIVLISMPIQNPIHSN